MPPVPPPPTPCPARLTRLILARATLLRTAARSPASPARGNRRAPADSPLNVLVSASWREASSLENRPRRRLPPSPLLLPEEKAEGALSPPHPPMHTRRQLVRGTQMVRGEEASTFFRLTWSCFICVLILRRGEERRGEGREGMRERKKKTEGETRAGVCCGKRERGRLYVRQNCTDIGLTSHQTTKFCLRLTSSFSFARHTVMIC